MKSIQESLRDPAWWFSVILVSLLINVVAAFAKDALSRAFTRYGAKRAEEKRKLEDRIVTDASKLSDNIEAKLHLYFAQTKLQFRMLFFGGAGSIGAISSSGLILMGAYVPGVCFGGVAVFLLISALRDLDRYNYLEEVVVSAHRRKITEEEKTAQPGATDNPGNAQ